MRTTIRRHIAAWLAVVAFCVAWREVESTSHAATDDANAGTADKSPPIDKSSWWRRPPLRISRETTYFTGPRTADGQVDYIAAINERRSQGVTAANNAIAPLLTAFGPQAILGNDPAAAYKPLGIEPLAADGKYLSNPDVVIHAAAQETVEQAVRAAEKAGTEISSRYDLEEQTEQRMRDELARPWRAAEHPRVAAWLRDQEANLKLVYEAADRPRLFVPIRGSSLPNRVLENVMFEPAIAAAEIAMHSAEALCIRAMLHAGEGRRDAAWRDAVYCLRLGTRWSNGPEFTDLLVGGAIAGKASHLMKTLLEESPPPTKDAARILAETSDDPKWLDVSEPVGIHERSIALAVLPFAAAHGTSFMELRTTEVEKRTASTFSKFEGWWTRLTIDLDYAARHINRRTDAIVAASALTTRAERTKAFDELAPSLPEASRRDDPSVEFVAKIQEASIWMFDWTTQRKLRGRHLARWAMRSSVDNTMILHENGTREEFIMHFRLARTGLALAAYRQVHGRFPDSLDALAPRYIPSVPTDPFSDAAFKYRRVDKGYLLYSVGENGKDDKGLSRWDDARCENEEAPFDSDDRAIKNTGKGYETADGK